jgi:citrate lyase subunit beta/citryl-CoA lyase
MPARPFFGHQVESFAMQRPRARRSVLYVPGSNEKAMKKTGLLACDSVIFDLEDAVAPDGKSAARAAIVDHFRTGRAGGSEFVIRVNPLSSQWGSEDVAAVAEAKPDAILIPKIESAGMLAGARRAIDAAGAADIPLWAMIETPLAFVNIAEIARAGTSDAVRLECMVAGTNDIAKETSLPLPQGRSTMVHWLAILVLHARAFGIDVLDGVYNDFRDEDGFAEECRAGALLGFDGKTLIHPSQIEPANSAFSPTDDMIEDAKAIIAVFDQPENADKGVVSVNGRMVERLHAEAARRLLTKVENIRA